MAEKPMNPFATTDFRNAMKEAVDDINRRVANMQKMHNINFTWADEAKVSPIETPKNRVVIQYSFNGAWTDFYAILLHNGYRVTAEVINDEEIEITWGDKA